MTTIILALFVFLLAVAGLGLGAIFGRRPIGGSCGGCVKCLVGGKRHD
jgi:hypothetical protein